MDVIACSEICGLSLGNGSSLSSYEDCCLPAVPPSPVLHPSTNYCSLKVFCSCLCCKTCFGGIRAPCPLQTLYRETAAQVATLSFLFVLLPPAMWKDPAFPKTKQMQTQQQRMALRQSQRCPPPPNPQVQTRVVVAVACNCSGWALVMTLKTQYSLSKQLDEGSRIPIFAGLSLSWGTASQPAGTARRSPARWAGSSNYAGSRQHT
jgi:hypothetical protein